MIALSPCHASFDVAQVTLFSVIIITPFFTDQLPPSLISRDIKETEYREIEQRPGDVINLVSDPRTSASR